jgi:esterase
MTDPILNHSRVVAPGREPARWLLILPGIYGTGRNWGTIAKRLVEVRPEWGVLLVDLRLHGGSTGFPPPHTLAAAADDVDRLVDHLDFHAAAVLGHSFGGKVALLYARRHGDELRQVWVMDSTPAAREPEGSAWRMIEVIRTLPEEFDSRQDAIAALEREGRYPTALAQWMAMNLELHDGRYRWRLDIDGVEEMLRDFFRTELWDVVDEPPGAVELHFVKATRSDTMDELSESRVAQASRASSRIHLHYVDAGHWLNADNPDALVALLSGNLP